ncbi:hypothetical protein [Muricoccus pecuniae]|uniref:Uncharacterized protein n=1 Tax=Muricoccus pecuniae TaxID=693023 RepID=A0A840Y6K2_9PROT|nr:hypothetical protein [Roseomonas pecuniae]MBB5696365.1 hypothetical protein [Roseomonas pecuniae]
MALTILPTPPRPVTRDAGRSELVQIWDGLDADGRRMLLAQARAVAEVTGRHGKVETAE